MTLTNNKDIYIYGGSFNPPTIAHKAVIEACIRQPECGELWVMPSGNRHDKQMSIENEHRIDLLKLLIGSVVCTKKIIIEELEISKDSLTQTYVTIENLNKLYPDNYFRYIFGSDSYLSMNEWQNGQYLKNNLPMLIIPRDGSRIETTSNIKVLNEDFPMNVSSSGVRTGLVNGQPIDHLVDYSIEQYIREHQLYVQ